MKKSERFRLKQCTKAVKFRVSKVHQLLTETTKYLDEIIEIEEREAELHKEKLHIKTVK